MAVTSFLEDEEFQNALVGLLCKDSVTLRRCASMLEPDDFKPLRGMKFGRARWIVAEKALEYYHKYQEPIGKLLRSTCLEYVQNTGLGERSAQEVITYTAYLKQLKLTGSQAIQEKITRFKRQRAKASAIQELNELQSQGQLTDEKWTQIFRDALKLYETEEAPTEYFETLEDRMERRRLQQHKERYPCLLIEPIDDLVKAIGPGQLGLCIGPYKRGKSMFLIWVAIAYAFQHLKILYITLEDPKNEVEDRMDSVVTGIPFSRLLEAPNLLKHRFRRYQGFLPGKLKLIDGRFKSWSLADIDAAILREHERGFFPDAVIVDYDAKLVTQEKHKEKRFESDALYNGMLHLASKYNQIWWTGAQTQRNTAGLKILSGDKLAEDINKIRNTTMAISLGKGDWGDNSIFMWIAAHKFDRMEVGANVVSDKSRALIFDRDATRQKMREEAASV